MACTAEFDHIATGPRRSASRSTGIQGQQGPDREGKSVQHTQRRDLASTHSAGGYDGSLPEHILGNLTIGRQPASMNEPVLIIALRT